jgi:hypothetical protein
MFKTGRALVQIFIFLIFTSSAFTQETSGPFSLNGYLVTMESAIFDSVSGPMIFDNVLHNRLNFKYYLHDKITLAAEFRNRLFTGDMARMGNTYSEIIGADEGIADLSWNIIKKKSFFLNTTIDRLYVDFNFDKFQARIGRQRINWGQALVWNPNDIFNAYSFFDIDYVERPGSDAIRLQYYPSPSSVIELAVKGDKDKDLTTAALYRFNKWGYDIQFLAGYSNSSDLTAGAGWSGTAGSFSFRGEGTWFHPVKEFSDTTGTVILTAGLDRIFKKNSILQLQLMYCNDPLDLKSFDRLYSGSLSAKDLAFSKFTAFGQFTWAATPLLNIGISTMWFPDLKGFFSGPSLDYSVAENLDFSLIWQHFDGKMGSTATKMNLVYLRVKYSF